MQLGRWWVKPSTLTLGGQYHVQLISLQRSQPCALQNLPTAYTAWVTSPVQLGSWNRRSLKLGPIARREALQTKMMMVSGRWCRSQASMMLLRLFMLSRWSGTDKISNALKGQLERYRYVGMYMEPRMNICFGITLLAAEQLYENCDIYSQYIYMKT